MTRHPLDTARSAPDIRLRQFLKIARAQAVHDSTRSLVARLRMRAGQRLRAYARIARGRQV